MKPENKRLLNAVLITMVSCLVVFAAAVSIFKPTTNTGLTPIVDITPSTPVDTTDITGSVVPMDTTSGGVQSTGSVAVCTQEYAPVCGSDNRTYQNSCIAMNLGVTDITPGDCTGAVLTGSVAVVVPTKTGSVVSGEITIPKKDQLICTREYNPVCGVDKKTYSNACMAGDTVIDHIGACDETEKPLYSTGSYHLYSNAALEYGFAIPKYSYYSGAGAQDGASHTMSIGVTASGILDFPTAQVQVWYFKKIPANPPSTSFANTKNGVIYVKNNDTTGNAKIEKIVTTVLESAE